MPLAVDRSFPWMQEVVIMLLLRGVQAALVYDAGICSSRQGIVLDKYLNNMQRTALDRLYSRILLAGIIHEAILFYFPPTRKEERRLLDLGPTVY
ncbi:hypothetical protein IEQ34_019970 [Dendrobium chrysotoxum]|uniref:Uncharacterized protein n=1 Tax=Dendrobium chrysotoxum TaxID=161865 RepID=A0AAV7G8D1_DENCH|nr:hypothetical protein IEQ34_019970 [Dendrobium chrysotoxum]